VNICIVADLSSLKFLFGIYFSQAAVETLNCTGNPFDDKLILGQRRNKSLMSLASLLQKKKILTVSLPEFWMSVKKI
jgi:hypothetical protein